MKRIFMLLLLPVIACLPSCDSSSGPNLTIIPTADSVSIGSVMNVALPYKTFAINDLTVNNSAVYTMTASVNNVAPDSFWASSIILTDHTYKKMSLNLSLFRDSTYELGPYFVTTNSSTLTDYSSGGSQVYSVLIGSYVNITAFGAGYITGTLNLQICYDHDTLPATGNFKIIQ